jgi:TonB family protein
MNDAPANLPAIGLAGPKPDGENWSRTKWLVLIALVFAAHIALIFAFGEKGEIVPRPAKNVPMLKLANDSDELLALDDPTLFALPHERDFASAALLKIPGVKQTPFRFTESPHYLPAPDVENLGATFQQFMRTNYFAGFQLNFKPPPKLSEPVLPIEPVLAQNSTLQIAGELAQRKLLNEINLPSLPFNDEIAPSKVQALVDAGGNVVSVVLLESSGLDAADSRALETARAARFAPAKNLAVGQMIFNWRTIPMTTTNDNPNAH